MDAILKDIATGIFGSIGVANFIVMLVFAMIGASISLTVFTAARKSSNNKWRCIIPDNIQRIVGGTLLVIVCIRFAPEILGIKPTPFAGLVIGISFDSLGAILKRFKVIDSKKPSQGDSK